MSCTLKLIGSYLRRCLVVDSWQKVAMRRALIGRCHGDVARGHVATDVVVLMMMTTVSLTVMMYLRQGEL